MSVGQGKLMVSEVLGFPCYHVQTNLAVSGELIYSGD